ncbi:TLC domain-containing protein 4-B [Rhodamnia argentea]|uniref:TLC domain-containing protein 4-B n=1 Tax=Rhodamnia argentea TaxID=178133 RepID=A0A8B8PRI9_9MYRT|nr:TLC domain-containing protein 4-B [Rhodamnia argentea]
MDALFSPRSISIIGYVPRKEFLWVAAVFSGIIMCCAVYKITGLISLLCFNGYTKLSNMDKLEWKNRGFSTFHAIIASSASLYLLLFSDLFKEDSNDELVINRTSTISETILGVSIGYFLSDLAMIVWHFPALGGWEYVLHHGLSMFSIFLSLVSGQGQIYILMVLFSESTTPFVNLRWYLDIAGQKSSDLYICNGIFLFLGWLVARILLFIFFFTHMLFHFDQVKEIFDLGFYSLLLVPPVLAIMNAFWFWKIAKGLVKTLCKKRHRQ